MEVKKKEYRMLQGPSRAQTKDPTDIFRMENFPGKKLLHQMFSVNENLKTL